MRIGILTFHRSINYGAFIQCYAFSQELKKRYPNHIVEVIDFEYLSKHTGYRNKYGHLNPLRIEYSIQYSRFQKDLSLLPLSRQSFITDDTDGLCEYIKRNYDIVIVGSDAVWADKRGVKEGNPYWLFGDKLNSVAKMSYAASAFSTKFDQLTSEQRDYYKDRLSSFYYIGVRDYATKDFVESLFNKDSDQREIHLNHDPSFFLNPCHNKVLVNTTLNRNFVLNKKPSISFMTRYFPYIEDIRKKYNKEYNLLHFYIRNSIGGDLKDLRCRYIFNLSPYEWYNMYSCMTLNFANYFHGACLGIVNHIPTIVVDDSNQNYMSKYTQVMLDLGLQDRLFKKGSIDKDTFFATIHYCIEHREEESQRLEKAIEKERIKSNSFFQALETLL